MLSFTEKMALMHIICCRGEYSENGNSALQICGHANKVRESIYVYSREDIHA